MALRDAGYETVMINCNPETVSTDYDTSDRLYFEPLTAEDVANVLDAELAAGGRVVGVIVSLGGQTPLKLAGSLPPELVLGTSPASIDLAEDRERGTRCATSSLHIPQPPAGRRPARPRRWPSRARSATRCCCARATCWAAGPWRSSTTTTPSARHAHADGALAREGGVTAERPVLVDRFLEDAVEVDVDAVRDAPGEILIAGVMEHVEEAGVHSGDSACALPPQIAQRPEVLAAARAHTRALADALSVCGLINVQYAVKDGQVYVLEANPRASRTVPFVAKATGRPPGHGGGPGDGRADLAELRPRACCRRRRRPGARRSTTSA
jgi:carbamoyl-phosphate synthase large subunit